MAKIRQYFEYKISIIMEPTNNQEIEYLDLALLNPEKVVIYTRWVDTDSDNSEEENGDPTQQEEHRRIGHLSSDNKMCHAYCGFNQFTKQTFPIPSKDSGWENTVQSTTDYETEKDGNETLEDYMSRKLKRQKKWIGSGICDPSAKIFFPVPIAYQFDPDEFKLYKTVDNGSIGFFVFVSPDKKTVYIYRRTEDVILWDDCEDPNIFNILVKKYEPIEIFIGTSLQNKMTDFSGGYGDKWDGNSILLRIDSHNSNNFKYVHIGTRIYEFVTDDHIISYSSSVGNNAVPYAYAESLNFCYDMSKCQKTPVTDHPDREAEGDVFYVETASYESFDTVKIAGRDSMKMRLPTGNSEKTHFVRFNKPVTIQHVANTCNL